MKPSFQVEDKSMKYGDIVVYNNQIGTVVKSENDFKFKPCNRGCCSFSLLDTITDNNVSNT